MPVVLADHGLTWIEIKPAHYAIVPTGAPAGDVAAILANEGYRIDIRGTAALASANGVTVEVELPPLGWLLLVIDDVGFSRQRVERMLAWQRPLVYSILPGRPHSKAIAAQLAARGETVFLHQPMQPLDYPDVDPGPGTLLLHDSPEKWRDILTANLSGMPQAVGLNNHMGSHFTQSLTGATAVAEFAAAHNLAVLDSLTAPRSKLHAACRRQGGLCFRRDLFLDDDLNPAAIDRQIEAWVRLAKRQGLAIAIGHPGPTTLDRLEAAWDDIDQSGVKLVSYSWVRNYLAQKDIH